MKLLKKNLKFIIGLIVGVILASGIVYAATSADKVNYTTNKNTEIKTVEDALNDLYVKANKNGFVAYFNSVFYNISKTERDIQIQNYNSSYGSTSNNILTITESGTYTAYIVVGHSPNNNTYTNSGYLYINNTMVKGVYQNFQGADGLVPYSFSVNEGETVTVKYTIKGDGNFSNTSEFGSVVIVKNS